MLYEADVEELLDLVVRNVKFFELLEGLDALDLLQFASREVKSPHVLEAGADLTE